MTIRNRAWRRRKARLILTKVKETKEWVVSAFKSDVPKGVKVEKPHRPGKLTRIQSLRQAWTLNQELADDI